MSISESTISVSIRDPRLQAFEIEAFSGV